MATGFACDSEIGAGAPPFRAVWRDPASTGAKMREQMCELMAQRALDLFPAVAGEARVEQHQFFTAIGAPRRTPQPARPFNFHGGCEQLRVEVDEKIPRQCLQLRVPPGTLRRDGCGKGKLELIKQVRDPPS